SIVPNLASSARFVVRAFDSDSRQASMIPLIPCASAPTGESGASLVRTRNDRSPAATCVSTIKISCAIVQTNLPSGFRSNGDDAGQGRGPTHPFGSGRVMFVSLPTGVLDLTLALSCCPNWGTRSKRQICGGSRTSRGSPNANPTLLTSEAHEVNGARLRLVGSDVGIE